MVLMIARPHVAVAAAHEENFNIALSMGVRWDSACIHYMPAVVALSTICDPASRVETCMQEAGQGEQDSWVSQLNAMVSKL